MIDDARHVRTGCPEFSDPIYSKIASLGVVALLSCFPAFGETKPLPARDARLAVLRELKIDAATITQVERDPSGTRSIVKLVLNPAKGSNINVEVWLPDADKWNARFLALGNGGAAGKINSGSLAGPSAAGYAVATTDMGTAPNPDSGIGNPEDSAHPRPSKAGAVLAVVKRELPFRHPPSFL